jgi:hypothetical protein
MTEMITHPKLLFDASAIERIRRNIETYDWARRLFEKLKHAVDGGEECFTSGAGRFTLTRPPAELSAFPDKGMARGAEGRLQIVGPAVGRRYGDHCRRIWFLGGSEGRLHMGPSLHRLRHSLSAILTAM